MWFSSSRVEKKSRSLPKHWPKPTADDLEECPKRVITIGDEQTYSFCDNFVKTSKYEVYNFLPHFLLEVFPFGEKNYYCTIELIVIGY